MKVSPLQNLMGFVVPILLVPACPKFRLEIKSYCKSSSLVLWFGVWSILPNPIDEYLPLAEKLAKSAKLASKAPIAAHLLDCLFQKYVIR